MREGELTAEDELKGVSTRRQEDRQFGDDAFDRHDAHDRPQEPRIAQDPAGGDPQTGGQSGLRILGYLDHKRAYWITTVGELVPPG